MGKKIKSVYNMGRNVRNFMDEEELEVYKKFLPENRKMNRVTMGPRTLVGISGRPQGERIVRVDGREVARYNPHSGELRFSIVRLDWGGSPEDYDEVIDYFEDSGIPYVDTGRPEVLSGPRY